MIVEPMRNQYRLIGNPLSFFAAQQLGLKSAPAETGTKEEIQVRNSFEQKDSRMEQPTGRRWRSDSIYFDQSNDSI